MNLSPYRKSITAVVSTVVIWAGYVVISDPAAITSSEWVTLASGLATALGVFAVPNSGVFQGPSD
jgi:hypothetical protein